MDDQSVGRSETPIDLERLSEVIPEGVHKFQIIEAEEMISTKEGSSGYPFIKLTMDCIEEGNYFGKRIWDNLSLSPAARFRVNRFLDAIDAPEKGTVYAKDFVGVKVRVNLTHEEFDGNKRERVERFLPWEDSSSPVPAKQLDFSSLGKKGKSKPPGKGLPDDVVEE